MADSMVFVEKLRAFWNSRIHDQEKWAFNAKLLHAAGLFA